MVMLVLLLTLMVTSLAGGVALLGQTERMIASAYQRSMHTTYAADAATRLAVASIAQTWQSRAWPAQGRVPALSSVAPVMAISPTEVVDLAERTDGLNQDAARRWPLGADTPQWRLIGWGRLPVPGREGDPTVPRVVVWVADDVTDGDGMALEDDNGLLMLRAEAFGLGGAVHVVVAHVRREAGGARVVTWREE